MKTMNKRARPRRKEEAFSDLARIKRTNRIMNRLFKNNLRHIVFQYCELFKIH